ncbi:MAG: hypothetical protein PUC66_00175 [Erysipelotrichaceae bacterium]|nr:hypothetical protein [Erysipelotrichaceae bacterium]
MPQQVRLTLWIVAAIFVFGGLLFWVIYPRIIHHISKENYKRQDYDVIARLVRDNDYYLINSFAFETGSSPLVIDHLIGGDKYLYVVIDYYLPGTLEVDPRLKYAYIHTKGNEKLEIVNPFEMVRAASERLSTLSGIPSDYFVGIALYNDDAVILGNAHPSADLYLCPSRKIGKIVRSYENRAVEPFVSAQLWQAIQDLHSIKVQTSKEKN